MPVLDQLDSPIFVVGNVHSGTTLVRKVLTGHPAVFSGRGESGFFHHLPIIRQKFPRLDDDDTLRAYVIYLVKLVLLSYGKANFDSNRGDTITLESLDVTGAQVDEIFRAAQQQRDHRQLFVLVSDQLTHFAQKQRWLEKTPAHLFHINQILRVVPNAHIIELVRDPRGILASKKARRTSEWMEKSAHRAHTNLKGGFDPLWDTIGWRSAVQTGNQAQKKYADRILRIKYEDFVQNPDAHARAVCEFVGLDYDPAFLDVEWTNSTSGQEGTSGIGVASVDKWRTRLTPAEIALCQWLAKSEMVQLGYTPLPTSLATALRLPFVLGQSSIELVNLLHRRWRLGGLSYLNNLMLNYRMRWRTLAKE